MRINRDRIEKTWPRKKFIGVYPRPFNFFRFVFIRVHSWPEGFHDTALNEKSAGFRLFACMNRLPNWTLVGKAYFLTWRLAGFRSTLSGTTSEANASRRFGIPRQRPPPFPAV
jgi:hypothetical protein